MSNNNQIDLIEFPANSAEEVKQTNIFFNEVFGWTFKVWGDEYIDTADSGIASGVNATDPAKRQTMPLAVIYSSDLEDAKERIIKAGGEIVQEIYPFPGGRRFHFKDPAGNELAVWSDKGK